MPGSWARSRHTPRFGLRESNGCSLIDPNLNGVHEEKDCEDRDREDERETPEAFVAMKEQPHAQDCPPALAMPQLG